jgi:hypothetical protein
VASQHLRMERAAPASRPQRLGWKIREKAEAFKTEPATGKGIQGNLGEPPSRRTSGVQGWQTEQRNARGRSHLTVAKESAVASHRKTPEARTVRAGKVPVTSVRKGSCAGLTSAVGDLSSSVSKVTPESPDGLMKTVDEEHRVAGAPNPAVSSATCRTGPAARLRAVRVTVRRVGNGDGER